MRILKHFAVNDHPVRSVSERDVFVEVASTPPHKEGNVLFLVIRHPVQLLERIWPVPPHPAVDYNVPMFRTVTFLSLILASTAVFGQTPPPGAPYDATKHPNPIITYVENKDFKPGTADMDLLGFSESEGKRESVEIAEGKYVKNMSILTIRTEVTFYPVVRQRFKLSGGVDLVLHSFRFPKVALPRDFTRFVLHEAATEKKKKPGEMRFGGAAPEQLEIRGIPGLLFDKDGEITIYWVEEGVGHTATASMPRRELFRVIEDLL